MEFPIPFWKTNSTKKKKRTPLKPVFPSAHPQGESLEERNVMDAVPTMTLPDALIALDAKTASMTLIQSHVGDLRTEISGLRVVHGEQQAAAGAMQTALVSTETQLQSALAGHAEVTATIASLTENIAALSTEEGEIETRLPTIEQDIAHLQEQIAQWNTARTDLTATLTTLETRMRDLRVQCTQEDTTVTQRTDDVTAKKTAVAQTDTTLKNDQNALQTAATSLSQAHVTLKTAQDTLTADQKKLSDAQVQLAQATRYYNFLYQTYGRSKIARYQTMLLNAKNDMIKAQAIVNTLTVTVKKDQDGVNAAKAAVDSWTKVRDSASSSVATDTDGLKQAQAALDAAVQALDAALAARGQTGQTITDLQPQIDALLTHMADGVRAAAPVAANLDTRSGDLRNAQTRLAEILRLLEGLRAQRGEARSTEAGLTRVIGTLRGVLDARRSAFDTVFAELAEEAGQISIQETDLLGAEAQAEKEAADVAAMQKIVADLLQLMLIGQEAAKAAAAPRIRESTILSRPSVEVIKNGDWLELRTRGFNGRQSFTFDGTKITPEPGNHIITIPGSYAPGAIPGLQSMLNHQTNAMPWADVPAPATAAGDLFGAPALGTWRAEIVAADGTAEPVALTQPAKTIPGTTGVVPDGETGRLRVHATQGKDIRLSFSITGEGRVMPHGTIRHLDASGSDGVTVTLVRVRPSGSRDAPWIKKIEEGGTIDFSSLREPFIGLDTGFRLELTISSDNNLYSSVELDVQYAVELASAAPAPAPAPTPFPAPVREPAPAPPPAQTPDPDPVRVILPVLPPDRAPERPAEPSPIVALPILPDPVQREIAPVEPPAAPTYDEHVEIADAAAMQKIVSDLLQQMLTAQEAAKAAAAPRIRESTILSRPSVDVIKNGDWLDLRTTGFDGKQSLSFGSARITPEAGDHIITIPGFYAPEALRDNIPELQTMLNQQTNRMPWVEVPAPATAAADLFSPSVLGTWRAEIVAADGSASPIPLTQPTANALGTTGLTGVTPDGETGRELTAATPLMTITRPTAQTIRMQMENMPAGYTIDVSRWFQTGGKIAYKTATTTGATTFSMDLPRDVQQDQKGYFWILNRPDGTTVRDGSLLMNQEMTPLMLTAITHPLPAGTRDLPLSIVSNGNTAATPVAADQSGGIRPLAPGSLLVHPMKGKDIRLTFAPTGESRVMPHGTIRHLDARGGNGVTVTLTRVRPGGVRDEPWTQKLENGGTLDFGSLREPFFGMAPGFRLELTIGSDGDDLFDSVALDVQFAVETPRSATATALPMGVVAPALQNRIGGDMIALTDVLSRGPVNFNSGNDAIARWITGGAYDTMDPNIKSDYRTIVDNAKAAMYPSYVNAMQEAFMDVLMEKNGVVRPRRSGGFVDPTGHNYHTAIPNAPTWGDFYAAADGQFEKNYSIYEGLCLASGTLMNAEKLRQQRTEQLAWATLDAKILAASTTPGAVSDDTYARMVNTIIEGHRADPDGGAAQLFRYAWSVQRNPTVAEVAGWTGKPVTVVQAALTAAGTDVAASGGHVSPEIAAAVEREQAMMNFLAGLTETERVQLAEDFAMTSYGVGSDTLAGDPVMLAALTSTDGNPGTKRLNNLKFVLQNAPGTAVWGGSTALTAKDFTSEGLQFQAKTNPYLTLQKIKSAGEVFQDMLKSAKTRGGINVNDTEKLRGYHEGIGMQLQNNADVGKSLSVLNSKIFYHIPASQPVTNGKLVILILGNSQTLGDSQAGIDQKTRFEAVKSGYEVLEFRVGELFHEIGAELGMSSTFELHPDIVLEKIRTVIQDRINQRGMFAGLGGINEVVNESYSWGGGTANRLFGTVAARKDTLGSASLKAVAYIDAVQLGAVTGAGVPVFRNPAAESVYNVYQLNFAPTRMYTNSLTINFAISAALDGTPMHGTFISGAENVDLGYSETHNSIDDNWAQNAWEFIMNKFSKP